MHIGEASGTMSFVYILQSKKTGRYYIGSTNDLSRRLAEHNSDQTKSLIYQRPLVVVFSKEYGNLSDARRIERKLKKMKSRSIIEHIVHDQEIKVVS